MNLLLNIGKILFQTIALILIGLALIIEYLSKPTKDNKKEEIIRDEYKINPINKYQNKNMIMKV